MCTAVVAADVVAAYTATFTVAIALVPGCAAAVTVAFAFSAATDTAADGLQLLLLLLPLRVTRHLLLLCDLFFGACCHTVWQSIHRSEEA